jgi:hypothetical protein
MARFQRAIEMEPLRPLNSWKDLYQWVRLFRKEHNLTSRRFLVLIGLQPRSAFIQYLSTLSPEPSKRPGSIGLQLRKALDDEISPRSWY